MFKQRVFPWVISLQDCLRRDEGNLYLLSQDKYSGTIKLSSPQEMNDQWFNPEIGFYLLHCENDRALKNLTNHDDPDIHWVYAYNTKTLQASWSSDNALLIELRKHSFDLHHSLGLLSTDLINDDNTRERREKEVHNLLTSFVTKGFSDYEIKKMAELELRL